jgi:phosphate-selective porin OprO/OprP
MSFRCNYLLAMIALVGIGFPGALAQSAQLPAAEPVQQIPVPPTLPEIPLSATQDRFLGPVLPTPSSLVRIPEQRQVPLETRWADGLLSKSSDNGFHIHVGGNAQVDSTWFSAPANAFQLPNNKGTSGVGGASATYLRRVRLRVEGEIYDQFDFIVEYDFANANNENDGLQPASFNNLAGQPIPTNIWMQVRDVPYVGNVRFGNLTKPIGMTNNTPQTMLPFMERPDNNDAFYAPFDSGFALGIVARNHTDNERVTWQYGVYRPATNAFGVALNKFEWGARVTGLPMYEDDGKYLIHLGMGTLNGEIVEDEGRARARPLLRNGPGFTNPILVDTGNFLADRQYTLAPEFAAVAGPWSLQAEWAGQFFTDVTPSGKPNQGTVLLHGGYIDVLYFLTGEYQPYNKSDGAFGRVIPNQNLRMKRSEGVTGFGAWQVGTRFSYLDLNDKAIQGGTVYDWTVGLNWYWNPNMKVQLNYILECRDQPGVAAAWINGIGLRGAYDF